MGIEKSPRQTKGISTDGFPCFHKTRISDELPASQSWNIFHIGLKTAFLQKQCHGVNRDVVCQLPPDAGHPTHIATA